MRDAYLSGSTNLSPHKIDFGQGGPVSPRPLCGTKPKDPFGSTGVEETMPDIDFWNKRMYA